MSLLTPLRRLRPGLVAQPRQRTLNTAPVDIRTLPNPAIGPNDRAWATLWHLEAHPDEWKQNTYGEFRPDGLLVGCFAHHLVRQAGYSEFGCVHKKNGQSCAIACACCRPARPMEPCNTADYVKTETGWQNVPSTATRLLGVASTADLYNGDNSLADIRRILTFLVGPEPVCRD